MPSWTIDMYAYGRLLHDFCEKLGIEPRATLVGNSMGGLIAAEAVLPSRALQPPGAGLGRRLDQHLAPARARQGRRSQAWDDRSARPFGPPPVFVDRTGAPAT